MSFIKFYKALISITKSGPRPELEPEVLVRADGSKFDRAGPSQAAEPGGGVATSWS